jgi:uncharacterized protein
VTRRPLVVGVTDLRKRPGTQRELHVAATLDGLGVSSGAVPPGGEFALDGLIEAIDGGITVTGRVTAPWAGECRRCLERVEGTIDTKVREVFEHQPTEGETYPIAGDEIDLEPVVRDAVLLALPLAPLCREDCPGPAPDSFPTGPTAAGAESGDEPGDRPADPRWAALSQLRFEQDEG